MMAPMMLNSREIYGPMMGMRENAVPSRGCHDQTGDHPDGQDKDVPCRQIGQVPGQDFRKVYRAIDQRLGHSPTDVPENQSPHYTQDQVQRRDAQKAHLQVIRTDEFRKSGVAISIRKKPTAAKDQDHQEFQDLFDHVFSPPCIIS